jgi:pimeloyl-ACP methyl ester carboxylesterase
MHRRYTIEAAEKLRSSELPVLLIWAPDDWLFPISNAERLASETPNARLVRVADAKTFVPIDQPQRVAEEIAAFAAPA